jgi:hypothetical protein
LLLLQIHRSHTTSPLLVDFIEIYSLCLHGLGWFHRGNGNMMRDAMASSSCHAWAPHDGRIISTSYVYTGPNVSVGERKCHVSIRVDTHIKTIMRIRYD